MFESFEQGYGLASIPVDPGTDASRDSFHEEPMDEESPCENDGVARLVKHLVMLASLLKELQTQSHLIHLNYEGDNFLEIHGFLKERYEEHLEHQYKLKVLK